MSHLSDQAAARPAAPRFDPSRVKYVQDVVAALSRQTNRAEKAERQVRDLTADNARLRAERDRVGPLVEFFREEGFFPYGHKGDYEGWSPEQTAVHFLRAQRTPNDGSIPSGGSGL